jgi:hypothetical protein
MTSDTWLDLSSPKLNISKNPDGLISRRMESSFVFPNRHSMPSETGIKSDFLCFRSDESRKMNEVTYSSISIDSDDQIFNVTQYDHPESHFTEMMYL